MDQIKYYWATILTKNNIGAEKEYETKLFKGLHPVEYVLNVNSCYSINKVLSTFCVVIAWGYLTEEEYIEFYKIQYPSLKL